MSQNPETIHQLMMVFSPRGTPDGYHRQHGFGSNTFKWVKDDSTFVYVKVHVRRMEGVQVRILSLSAVFETSLKFLDLRPSRTHERFSSLGKTPNIIPSSYTRQSRTQPSLNGKCSSWVLSVCLHISRLLNRKQQTMTETQANTTHRHIAFDATKIWPQGANEFPLQEIGKLVLNENPNNYFDEIEQVW